MAASSVTTCTFHFSTSSVGPAPLFARSTDSRCWYFAYIEFAPELDDVGGSDLNVGIQHQHVLLGLGELGAELSYLVLVDRSVETKQRRSLLDADVLLHEDRLDERRLGKTRSQLNGVLNELDVLGIRRDEAQADQEDEAQMEDHEAGHHSPSDRESQPSELEEDQPYEERVAE